MPIKGILFIVLVVVAIEAPFQLRLLFEVGTQSLLSFLVVEQRLRAACFGLLDVRRNACFVL